MAVVMYTWHGEGRINPREGACEAEVLTDGGPGRYS